LVFIIVFKINVVGLHPTPDQKGKSAYSPFGNPPASLAKLHALISGFVLIRKSLTLPMGRPFPPKATQTSCLRHAIFFNALQQLRRELAYSCS